MKTFDEAVAEVCRPDDDKETRHALCEAKVVPFLAEAKEHPIIQHMLCWGFDLILGNLMEDDADDEDFRCECGSVMISLLLYGVAIGREMEKGEF